MAADKKPPGLLDQADIDLIKDKYDVQVDADNVTQYKLCQIILHLEKQLKDSPEGE